MRFKHDDIQPANINFQQDNSNMTRVQIPAYTDRWMMGDRFGEIVSIKMARPKNGRTLLLTNARNQLRLGDIEIARVKLDKSGKVVRVVLSDCEVVS